MPGFLRQSLLDALATATTPEQSVEVTVAALGSAQIGLRGLAELRRKLHLLYAVYPDADRRARAALVVSDDVHAYALNGNGWLDDDAEIGRYHPAIAGNTSARLALYAFYDEVRRHVGAPAGAAADVIVDRPVVLESLLS